MGFTMPEWMAPVLQTVGTIAGSGILLALVNGWNERKRKGQELSAEDRKDAVGILREALAEKRKDHTDCEQRVTQVEAAMFREREAREAERESCRAENAKLQAQVTELRDLVLASYAKPTQPPEPPPPPPPLRKLPPARPAPAPAVDVVEVDPRQRKA